MSDRKYAIFRWTTTPLGEDLQLGMEMEIHAQAGREGYALGKMGRVYELQRGREGLDPHSDRKYEAGYRPMILEAEILE